MIMYEGEGSGDSSKSKAIHNQLHSFRNILAKLGVEQVARVIWHAYLEVNRALEPQSPISPEYWRDRIQARLPRGRKTILDFGGGSGPYRRWLADEDDTYIILEVNPNSAVVGKHRKEHQYVIGDGHSDLFVEDSFDVITMFCVLEHLRDPFRAFRNCARWLKPNGRLVIVAPQYWHVHGWPSDYFRYTCYGLKELTQLSGLKEIDLWPTGGPCVLIWTTIELNFGLIFKAPIIKQVFSWPILLLARIADRICFAHNENRINPDTVGWGLIVTKEKYSRIS